MEMFFSSRSGYIIKPLMEQLAVFVVVNNSENFAHHKRGTSLSSGQIVALGGPLKISYCWPICTDSLNYMVSFYLIFL